MTRRPSKGKPRDGKSLPTKAEILEFVQGSPDKVGKREIARAFGIKGGDRVGLKKLLREMADEGLIAGSRKRLREPGSLPPVAVLNVVERDEDGEFVAVPANWDEETDGPRPRLLVAAPEKAGRKAGGAAPEPGIGDRVLARIQPVEPAEQDGYAYLARPIKRLARETRRLLGIYRTRARGGGIIDPVDRRALREWDVAKGDEGKAGDGDLVRFVLARDADRGQSRAEVIEVLGNPDDQRQISLIAVHAHGIPDEFPEKVLAELDDLPEFELAARTDLRDTPLVTIDPPDARDHDDAVWAAPDTDTKNPGGWVVIVAIADVAHYVRGATELDASARERGNSVYFPDRVVAMLPERISNDLCSLREGEERPCLALRMVFDAQGKKKLHRFERAVMRSHAKLSYTQAQEAIDGRPDDTTGPLLESVLEPLWGAYRALAKARDERAPLDLDIPERRILLDDKGRVHDIVSPERLTAHRLIEEFMIQANVAAAETLEAQRTPLIYRVHEPPSPEKLKALKDFLDTLDIPFAKSGPPRPAQFNRVLAKVDGTDVDQLVSEVVLRAQSQAQYSIRNAGHFGLNLDRYAHFTSPIRRYADLIVHRALVRALELGAGGLPDEQIPELEEVAGEISEFERRAMAAERETADRLVASHLSERIGTDFTARISGVTRSGLFVRLDESGADGFVPVATIGDDFYHYDEDHHAMVGKRTGETYQLGDRCEVRLVEAIPTAGALRFDILTPGRKKPPEKRGRRGRPPRRRGR